MICRCITLQTTNGVVQIGRRRLKYLHAPCTLFGFYIGRNPLIAMRSRIVDESICLCVRLVFTRRARIFNGCVLILFNITWVRIIRMNSGQMVQIGRLLEKFRSIITFLAFKWKILFVVPLNMIMHGILLLFHYIAVGTNKITIGITSVFGKRCRIHWNNTKGLLISIV